MQCLSLSLPLVSHLPPRGVPWSEFFPGLQQAVLDAPVKHGVTAGLIMCFLRHLGPQAAADALEQVHTARLVLQWCMSSVQPMAWWDKPHRCVAPAANMATLWLPLHKAPELHLPIARRRCPTEMPSAGWAWILLRLGSRLPYSRACSSGRRSWAGTVWHTQVGAWLLLHPRALCAVVTSARLACPAVQASSCLQLPQAMAGRRRSLCAVWTVDPPACPLQARKRGLSTSSQPSRTWQLSESTMAFIAWMTRRQATPLPCWMAGCCAFPATAAAACCSPCRRLRAVSKPCPVDADLPQAYALACLDAPCSWWPSWRRMAVPRSRSAR